MLALALSGCAQRIVEYGGARYSSFTLGSDTMIGDIEIVIDPDGTRRLIVHGFGSEQSQALEAIAEGAVRGAIKAVAPVP